MRDDPARDPLADLEPGLVVLVQVAGEDYADAVASMIKTLQSRNRRGIVINVSRPRTVLEQLLKERTVDLEELRFVDCISKLVNADVEDTDRAVHLDSPTMLEMIAMGVDHFAEETGQGDFVMLESFGSLVTYNNFDLVYEFTNFLMNKLRVRQMSGVLVVVEGQLPEQIQSSIAQLSDSVVDWRGDHGSTA